MNARPLPDWSAAELCVTAPAPGWFHEALAHPFTSQIVDVEDCPIHYLAWPCRAASRGGILFVHGGGAHANWWRFIAPFFTARYRVAALDLSGMGDSGRRPNYDAGVRAREMRAVIGASALPQPVFVVGHSFGGYMTMRFAAAYGAEVAGAVIVDSPIRRPSPDGKSTTAGRGRSFERHYPTFDIALERFRLLPLQECANDFLVEFIARHSVRHEERGWTWKFDVAGMGPERWREPFADHLRAMACRRALIHGARSALVSAATAAYMAELMGAEAPVVAVADAAHHVMLDQPLAFVTALDGILDAWLS